ncbi:MAG: hypothetical protein WCT29_00070 [Candidatus Paceibacterota bacterium]|jgi:chaperonin cofactor prefoldin
MKKEVKKTNSKIDGRLDKFEKILQQHKKAFILTMKEIQAFREEAREYRQTMGSLMHTDIKQERDVEDLKIRVERLEMRIK